MPSQIASLAMKKMTRWCINAVWVQNARNATTYAVGNLGTLITARPTSSWRDLTKGFQIATNVISGPWLEKLKRTQPVEVAMTEMIFTTENTAPNANAATTETNGVI